MSTATATPSPGTFPSAERARLSSDISIAGTVAARSWPLENFIAVNPLGGFEDMEFSAAGARAGEMLGARGTLDETAFRQAYEQGRISDEDLDNSLRLRFPEVLEGPPLDLGGSQYERLQLLRHELQVGLPQPAPVRTSRTLSETIAPAIAAQVDAQTTKWCSAYMDQAQSGWRMPGQELGFYPAWKDLACRDRSLSAEARKSLAALPERPEDAILLALQKLAVPEADQRQYLQAHITSLPGWSAHIRLVSESSDRIGLPAYLAMRTSYESVLLEGTSAQYRDVAADAQGAGMPAGQGDDERAGRVASSLGHEDASPEQLSRLAVMLSAVPVAQRTQIWLGAYEGNYRDSLLESLSRPSSTLSERPASQVVCCIDVRSEGMRRHLEETGPHETLGFAGFFAVAIKYQNLAGGQPTSLCPVLLEAGNQISEVPQAGTEGSAERQIAGEQALAGAGDSFHAAESHMMSPFVLAETTGWTKGPVAAARTLVAGPFGRLRKRLQNEAVPQAPTVLTVEKGFSLEERLMFSEVALTMMGLTENFGRLVVLCGHGSTTENNPYESALDCGACGGNRGAPNARTAAAILNSTEVRTHLITRGISIPEDTWFVAGEHDTATDQVELLDRHLIPSQHAEDMERLERDLALAGSRLSAERCESMPGAPDQPTPESAAKHVGARSTDWAQVFPEWGLAGNAAFIVGPRSMTRGIDLGRRTFLHSYVAAVDHEGEALETILTAPLVVAQWINSQYYFSTVDPMVFGSGSKTIHNVVGGFGVLAGHGGDLQQGLPWQSVSDGERLVHEPMRLLAVVQAPLERIDAIVDRNPLLQDLFGNGWLALAARENDGQEWKRHTPAGWQAWNNTEKEQI